MPINSTVRGGTSAVVGQAVIGDSEIVDSMFSVGAEIQRSKLAQEAKEYMVPWSAFRVHDAIESLPPQPAAGDDLGWPATQNFGTVSPYLETIDTKQLGIKGYYTRFQFQLPPEYSDGQSVTARFRCAMKTTVADVASSIWFYAHEANNTGGVGSNLASPTVQNMNNLTPDGYDYTIDPTGLTSGDWLDCDIGLLVSDTATATAVIGVLYKASFVLTVRG